MNTYIIFYATQVWEDNNIIITTFGQTQRMLNNLTEQKINEIWESLRQQIHPTVSITGIIKIDE